MKPIISLFFEIPHSLLSKLVQLLYPQVCKWHFLSRLCCSHQSKVTKQCNLHKNKYKWSDCEQFSSGENILSNCYVSPVTCCGHTHNDIFMHCTHINRMTGMLALDSSFSLCCRTCRAFICAKRCLKKLPQCFKSKCSVRLGGFFCCFFFKPCVSVTQPQRRLAGKRVIDSTQKKISEPCHFMSILYSLWSSLDGFVW